MLGLHNLFNKLTGRATKNKDRGDTPLYKAVKNGNLKEVKRLLRSGADPNIANTNNLTPLHQASYWGETEIVELLLKHGAKANADNGKGWTPLHSAAVSGGLKIRGEIIELLLKHGASPDKQDKHGWTPKDYMTLWETSESAAEKLKQYLNLAEGRSPPNNPSGGGGTPKPPRVNTPVH